ncbi:LOG family protein [Candidatus Kaiserbacteria bacterium]|nr:LOG family protein [Candidatus Kaiserbacteria bacterium]
MKKTNKELNKKIEAKSMENYRKITIGVMGSWSATDKENKNAETLGKLIANKGWVTLSGGEPGGVMQAVSKGAKEADGWVVGILPQTSDKPYSEYLDVAIFTNASAGRNYFNILSSDVVIIASKLSAGTLMEATTALRLKKPIVVLNNNKKDQELLKDRGKKLVSIAKSPEDVIRLCEKFLEK